MRVAIRERSETTAGGWLGIMVLAALLAAGCSSQQVATEGIQFQVAPRANRNAPVALDLVLIFDPTLLQMVRKFSAAQWFEHKEQLMQRFPEQLLTWEWEVVPGAAPGPFSLPKQASDALGVLLFANYGTPGLHSARLDPYRRVLIRLDENALRVFPIEYH